MLAFLLLGVTACGGGGSSNNNQPSSSVSSLNSQSSQSSASSVSNGDNQSSSSVSSLDSESSQSSSDNPSSSSVSSNNQGSSSVSNFSSESSQSSVSSSSEPDNNDPDENPPSVWRPFSDDSPWNQPISENPDLHPQSAQLIEHMIRSVSPDYLWLNIQEWSIPVYEVDNTEVPFVNVSVTSINGASTGSGWLDVFPAPIPEGAAPDRQSDAHMVILDRAQNKSWDFWHASKTDDGQWQCGVCNTSDLSGTGVRPLKGQGSGQPWFRSHGARACGLPLLAGLIRPEEIAAGRIDHALYIGYPGIRSNIFTSPASTAQAPSKEGINHCEGIPCGGRIQLDPNLDLNSLGLTREARIIAEALQTYGAYVGDYAGISVVLNVQNDPNALTDLSGVLSGNLLSNIPIEHFRVVQWGQEHVDQEIPEPAACLIEPEPEPEPEPEEIVLEEVECTATMFGRNGSAATNSNNSQTRACARIQVGDLKRHFMYEVPEDYDADGDPYPVVFAWHGCGGSGGGMRESTTWHLREQPVIAVYPHSGLEDSDGQLDPESNSCWISPIGTTVPTIPHLDFFDALLEVVKANFNVDEEQIISLGYSSGAAMSHYLGCERADLLKGVIAVAGWPTGSCASSETPGAAIPIVFAHGEHDTAVPFSHFDSAVTGYVNRNSCDSNEIPITLDPPRIYRSCYERTCGGASLAYCISECDGLMGSDLTSCQSVSGHALSSWDSWFYRLGLSRLLSN